MIRLTCLAPQWILPAVPVASPVFHRSPGTPVLRPPVERRADEADAEPVTVCLMKLAHEGMHLVNALEHLECLFVKQMSGLAKA
jgi:hypothetical protein